ncbi:hypothetical protein OIU79_000299 [Salix purpurea]|uniref:Uncharacterized protein n=1 Tax=Salix purpurea TaxID=77065 RepID=A0A9Q0V118_SALPP|nr:hypothetical protein OIU79_000299 [Salix purpurea]
MFSLVETKLHETNLKKVQNGLEVNKWHFISNGSNTNAARIIVGWDPQEFVVVSVNSSSKWVTCRAHMRSRDIVITMSFFYGHNTPAARQEM